MDLLALIMAATLAAQASPQSIAALEAAAPRTSPVVLPGAVQLDMTCKVTGRTYRIFVSKPTAPATTAGLPVLYLLDGDWSFANFHAAIAPLEGRSPVRGLRVGRLEALFSHPTRRRLKRCGCSGTRSWKDF